MLEGIVELAEDVFKRQVRIANPKYSGNLSDVIANPRYATAMGLIMEAKKNMQSFDKSFELNSFSEMLARMKSWFVGNF